MAGSLEKLGTIEEMKARLLELQERAARDHAERMSLLPLDTCPMCYGVGKVRNQPCPECQPTQTYADGTPYEFHNVNFSNFTTVPGVQTALAKAQAFLDPSCKRDLYLTGGVGAGKTRLACSILNEAVKRGKWSFFARVPMLLHQLQPGQREQSGDLEHRLMRSDLVVLDDLGAERDQASDYTRRTLLMIYEERGDRGLRTIFTSNKTIQQLGDMHDDDRLASRIAGRADAVQLTTADQRMARRRS